MTSPEIDAAHVARQKAFPLVMWGGPGSPQAHALIEDLLQTTILPARAMVDKDGVVQDARPSSVQALRTASGALLADLFDFHRGTSAALRPRQGYHGMSRSDFSKKDLGFAYDMFRGVVSPLVAEGFISQADGNTVWRRVEGQLQVVGGSKTCFGLTEAMVNLGAYHGVTIGNWGTHWTRFAPGRAQPTSDAPRLVLRQTRERKNGKKLASKDHAFDPAHPVAHRLLQDVGRLNSYLGEQRVSGIAFAGLRRIFNNGEVTDYGWNKGGRYYSLPGGHRYEAWNSTRRCESIRLNGEAVTEVDLRASHLTLLHGLLGDPFDAREDPYEFEDIPRAVIKAWVAQAIGAANSRPFQWSDDAEDSYEEERPGRWMGDEFPIREVRAAIVTRHPALLYLETCGIDTLDLQCHEAEILRLAMETLMFERDIPVLPIHDALIVPLSAERVAQGVLRDAFKTYVEGVMGHPSTAIPEVTLKSKRKPLGD